MIVVLIAIIEVIVIGFIYMQNIKVFYTDSVVLDISFCLKDKLEASRSWHFGIDGNSPFLSIFFTCTCFLLTEIIANFINKYMYQPYFDRNYHPNG